MVIILIGDGLFTAAADQILPEGDERDDDNGNLRG